MSPSALLGRHCSRRNRIPVFFRLVPESKLGAVVDQVQQAFGVVVFLSLDPFIVVAILVVGKQQVLVDALRRLESLGAFPPADLGLGHQVRANLFGKQIQEAPTRWKWALALVVFILQYQR